MFSGVPKWFLAAQPSPGAPAVHNSGGTELPPWDTVSALGLSLTAPLPSQGNLIAFIGRDMLANFVMTYDGQTGRVTLAW